MRTVPRYDYQTDGAGRLLARKVPPPPVPSVRSDRLTVGEHLAGRRVIIVEGLQWLLDMRAVDEPRDGFVLVIDEADWYAFRDAPDGFPPSRVRCVACAEVWTD